MSAEIVSLEDVRRRKLGIGIEGPRAVVESITLTEHDIECSKVTYLLENAKNLDDTRLLRSTFEACADVLDAPLMVCDPIHTRNIVSVIVLFCQDKCIIYQALQTNNSALIKVYARGAFDVRAMLCIFNSSFHPARVKVKGEIPRREW